MSNETLVRRLAERVKLLDRVICEHHSSSVMREEHDVCPVCMEHGGVGFFLDTSDLLRRCEEYANQTEPT